jgi:uncharacterized protein (TIGR00369 family)
MFYLGLGWFGIDCRLSSPNCNCSTAGGNYSFPPAAKNNFKEGIILMNKKDIENRGLDEGFFDFICNDYLERHPILENLSIETTYMGEGIVGLRMCPDAKYSSDGGRVHGGMLATLADCVMGRTAFTATRRLCRTVDMTINYLAPVFEETELIAEGHVIHHGRTILLVEGSLFNSERKLIAKSRGTFIIDTKYPPVWEK